MCHTLVVKTLSKNITVILFIPIEESSNFITSISRRIPRCRVRENLEESSSYKIKKPHSNTESRLLTQGVKSSLLTNSALMKLFSLKLHLKFMSVAIRNLKQIFRN